MSSIRRVASIVVIAWLILRAAGIAAAAFDVVDLSAAVCACAHHPGGECPMHHHGGDPTVCHWRSSLVALSPSITLTFGPVGFASVPESADVPRATAVPRQPIPALSLVDPRPTTPPPRA